jgi:hypothetical protein
MNWIWAVPVLMGVFVTVWLVRRQAKAKSGRDQSSTDQGAFYPIGADGGGRKSDADHFDMSDGGGGDGGGGD